MALSAALIQYIGVVLVLLSDNYYGVADAFCSYRTSFQGTRRQLRPNFVRNLRYELSQSNSISRSVTGGRSVRYSGTGTFLVSEEDVLEAVELAETLWADALEARETANGLVDRAEEEAISSAGTAKKAENIFQDKTTPVTMEQLVQADGAAKASLDATIMVNEAMQASDDADRLESEAEEALKKSEEKLEQHVIDFPDSLLAE